MPVMIVCLWCGGTPTEHEDGCPNSGKLRQETQTAHIPYVQPTKEPEVDADETASSE